MLPLAGVWRDLSLLVVVRWHVLVFVVIRRVSANGVGCCRLLLAVARSCVLLLSGVGVTCVLFLVAVCLPRVSIVCHEAAFAVVAVCVRACIRTTRLPARLVGLPHPAGPPDRAGGRAWRKAGWEDNVLERRAHIIRQLR